MGTSYKGGSPTFRTITENVSSLKNKFPVRNGYFGTEGQGRSFTRNITSIDPKKTAKEFYDQATYGGIEEPVIEKKTGNIIGKKTRLADGSVISWRENSKSDGTSVVEINIERSFDSGGIKKQKIHFIEGGNFNV